MYANMTSVPCWNSDNVRSILRSFTYANEIWTGAKDMKRRRHKAYYKYQIKNIKGVYTFYIDTFDRMIFSLFFCLNYYTKHDWNLLRAIIMRRI